MFLTPGGSEMKPGRRLSVPWFHITHTNVFLMACNRKLAGGSQWVIEMDNLAHTP